MHRKKAETLATYDKASRMYGDMMRYQIRVAIHPDTPGLFERFAAVAMLPVLGTAALTADIAYVTMARTPDEDWERAFPTRDEASSSDQS